MELFTFNTGLIIPVLLILCSSVLSELPICVIGGGLSGLAITLRLQDRGFLVHLYEKDDVFGGKMSTFRTKGGMVLERGPVAFASHHHYIQEWLDKYNLSTVPYDLFDLNFIDPVNAAQFRYIMSPEQWNAVEKNWYEVADIMGKIPTSQLEMGYPDLPPDSDLALPFGEWLEKHGHSELNIPSAVMGTSTGYGDINAVPTIYWFRMLMPNDTAASFRRDRDWRAAKDGFSFLAFAMANDVIHKFLNHEAVKITRDKIGAFQDILFQTANGTKVKKRCGKTVLAFPPIIRRIRIIQDLTHLEEAVFSQVRVHKYMSSGNVVPSMVFTNYYGFSPKAILAEGNEIFPAMKYPDGEGGVVLFAQAKASKIPHSYTAYSWIAGDYVDKANEKDLMKMESRLSSLIKRSHPLSQTLWTRNWEYFPHATTESIRGGFYKKLNEIQGTKGVYYASTLLTFEMMNYALEMAHKFTDKYF